MHIFSSISTLATFACVWRGGGRTNCFGRGGSALSAGGVMAGGALKLSVGREPGHWPGQKRAGSMVLFQVALVEWQSMPHGRLKSSSAGGPTWKLV